MGGVPFLISGLKMVELRAYELNIRYFPAAVAQSLVLLLLISPFIAASFYLVRLRMTDAIPLSASPVLSLLALLLLLMLVQTAQAYTIGSLLRRLGKCLRYPGLAEFGSCPGRACFRTAGF